MVGRDHAVTAFRLCVDLNIWIKQFFADKAGRQGTAPQRIVRAVLNGEAGVGPIQLVISHTMLSRLHSVYLRKGIAGDVAADNIETIANFALLGPAAEYPRMVLGGGVQPTREAVAPGCNPYDPAFSHKPYDPEDGRVLDTALAGQADALVTSNFKDFVHYSDGVVRRGRVHVRRTAGPDLWIVQPEEMADWLRTGIRPGPTRNILMRRGRPARPRQDTPTDGDDPSGGPKP